MQMIQRYPYSTLGALNHLFGNNTQARSQRAAEHAWSPSVDISETEDRFRIVADVPGLTAEQVDVSVEKRVLTINGTRASSNGENDQVVRSERYSGAFNRRFTLPEEIDVEGISAKVEHGVLTIEVPKAASSTTRQISVQSAA